MRDDRQSLHIISCFGLPLGVGDKTIDEICKAYDIDTYTFLTVINYALWKSEKETHPTMPIIWADDLHIPSLMRYIRSGHTYFLDSQFPRIRQQLLQAIHTGDGKEGRIHTLIVRLFDEWVNEVGTHIEHEDKHEDYMHHAEDDQMANKLRELKELIIKYYPQEAGSLLFDTLQEIGQVEDEVAIHCGIEEDLLMPALKRTRQNSNLTLPASVNTDEALSDREKDVLIEVVNGLSNKEIADCLCISPYTVMSHRKNIARKLNIHSTAGLTIYAIVNGLIEI